MPSENKLSFILASQSPRRKELVGWLDIPFEIIVPDIEEVSELSIPEEIAKDVSEQKAQAVWDIIEKTKSEELGKLYFPFILASDTMVCLKEKIYGKPKDVDDARRILMELSGHQHSVVTGVSMMMLDPVSNEKNIKNFAVKTDVTFDPISEEILENYLKTGESLDKAGAYGIQGKGLTFISNLNGSYSNVVGFPLSHFVTEAKSFLKLEKGQRWSDFFI
ncbi:MAG: septum formation protein Maf [Oligoflexia bacterium]|nr:septum formation protein Maf [Oligoflexia bacterium]